MKPVSLESVRQVNPVRDADAVVDLTARAHALDAVLDLPQGRPVGPGRRSRPHRRRLLVAVVAASLGIVASGVAASGILSGATYRPPAGFPINHDPRVGIGVTVSGSPQLMPLRVPDPVGGLPWGLRVLRTTRGLSCVQVGRVLNGQLGVMGQDGVAGDDHRFHALPADLVQPWNCVSLGGARSALIGIAESGDFTYASGPVIVRSCPAHPAPGSSPCPLRDRRTFAYGLLGPNASGLTYRFRGRTMTVQPVGGDGAYLVVLPGATPGLNGRSVGAPGYVPGVITVAYKGGLSCSPNANPPSPACAREQSAPTAVRPPRIAAVRVHTAIRRYESKGATYADLVVRFRAPVAITQAALSYWLMVNMPSPCGGTGFTDLNRDVTRGAPVALHMLLPGNCPGTGVAHVLLSTTAAPDQVPPLGPGSERIATFTVRLPRTTGTAEWGSPPAQHPGAGPRGPASRGVGPGRNRR